MTTTYENAPSTILLATNCACCGRALRDAESVERGVGPDCAEKYGYGLAQGTADWAAAMAAIDGVMPVSAVNPTMGAHKAANVLTHHAACVSKAERAPFVAAIRALGFTNLADKLAAAAGISTTIEITRGVDCFAIKTPFSEEFVDALKAARIGARWNRDAKVWEIPQTAPAARALFLVLRATFAGSWLKSEKGTTLITAVPPPPPAPVATDDCCPRCNGAGRIAVYAHVEGGVCFRCRGTRAA